MSYKSVQQECPHKSVPQEFPTRVTHKSVLQECPTRVSQKSVPQECPTRVSFGHMEFFERVCIRVRVFHLVYFPFLPWSIPSNVSFCSPCLAIPRSFACLPWPHFASPQLHLYPLDLKLSFSFSHGHSARPMLTTNNDILEASD